jgi:NAD(P)-dependent dehydrogenase (short-subunit alcohol dehydrogenase family)
MDYYRNKIALVTGGASGIGRELTRALARRGARVVCADINDDGARQTVACLDSDRGSARAAHLDVTREGEVNRLVDETVTRYGRLDLMFNNAGIGIGGEFRDMTTSHWHSIVEVNLWGTIYGTAAAYRVMIKQGSGSIVNMASIAGLLPVPTLAAYATVKHAVVGLSTSIRPEAADFGVRVIAVCPGAVNTGLFKTTPILGADKEDLLERFPFVMDVQKVVPKILHGVRKNRALIVFPLSNTLLWRFYRLWPAAVAPLSLKMVRNFRRFRKDVPKDLSGDEQ